MSRKKKNNKEHRGPTFVGYFPRVEDRFLIKKRKQEKKHKKQIQDYDCL